ncbi:hypothetical protein [Bacillus phage BC-T25]|nr:hypothetical protein [Bacillus phage BC-T25]
MKTKVKLRVLFYERIVPSSKDFGSVFGVMLLFNIILYFYPIADLQRVALAMLGVCTAAYILVVALWYSEISSIVEEIYQEEALNRKYSFISKRFKEGK